MMSKNRKVYILIILISMCVIALLLCFGPIQISFVRTGELYITEVCTHNKKAAHDEYGYYDSDYIEIFNPTNKTVNLLGWGLSDDSSKLGKYLFPNINIEPGQAIIAWSSEDLYPSEVWRDDYVPSDVHGIGFNISDGEKCILTDPSGKIVSTVVTPQ